MTVAGFLIGFADFASSLPISQVADLLSARVFGGIRFVEKDVDEEYDLGTLCLAHDFLGVQVDLVGQDGRYTLELGTRPSASVATINVVCDLSAMLRQRLAEVDEIQLLAGRNGDRSI